VSLNQAQHLELLGPHVLRGLDVLDDRLALVVAEQVVKGGEVPSGGGTSSVPMTGT
jgi:hypothetical protein